MANMFCLHLYLILFIITSSYYVSCESGRISTEDKNIRTVLCNNQPFCKYGNTCNYYHSPFYYPDSTHVKYIFKTPLCPKEPGFGDGELFHSHKKHLKFEDVNTLASYCSMQLLLINILCKTVD